MSRRSTSRRGCPSSMTARRASTSARDSTSSALRLSCATSRSRRSRPSPAILSGWPTGSWRSASRPWPWNRPACTGCPCTRCLQSRGIEVIVANAREARAVPGRKSDVNDAQWLQRLHACGLLRASFRPERDIAALRAYLRLRERHLDYAAAHIQHMQKALTFMNLQLHHVVSDITGVTGMKIIRAIVGGQRDPEVLATMRDVRCKASTETVRAALVGNYQPEHLFALAQALALYDFYQARVAECDAQIERALAGLNADKQAQSSRCPSRGTGPSSPTP